MVLSVPLLLQNESIERNLSYVYQIFNPLFIQQDKRPRFNGKKIYFEVSKSLNGKILPYPEKLMHIVSLEEKNEHTILPCNNDIASNSCYNQCEFSKAHFWFVPLDRNECLYRMARIHWIPEIIELANNQDIRIKVWVEKKKNKRGRYAEKTYLRFQDGIVDYVVILGHRFKGGNFLNYVFESAFPVFIVRSKKQYDQRYSRYIKTLQTN